MEPLASPSPDLDSAGRPEPTPPVPRRASARLINFGLFGAAVSTLERILPNTRCRLLCAAGDGEIEIEAEAIRSMFRVAADGSPYYEVGLRFNGVLGEVGQRVLMFMVEVGAIGADDRVAERFSASDCGRLTIEFVEA
ncbi:MAG TPA: hypothetical protein VGS22_03330 [Thermoanaerobaculia bacterium]|jgi:hypothetical protein|nr:hypothetical protein [Thermoanaerobaculia bacterium]